MPGTVDVNSFTLTPGDNGNSLSFNFLSEDSGLTTVFNTSLPSPCPGDSCALFNDPLQSFAAEAPWLRSPQSPTPQQPQKKPCTPLANNLQGTPAAGVDTLFDAFSRVTHPLDMLAVNATMFVAAGGQIVAGGLAIGGGCLEPTPFEPLTCIAGGAAGTVSIASGTASGAFGVYFFKNYTLPAIKDWGCHE